MSEKSWSLNTRLTRAIHGRLTLLAFERPQIDRKEAHNATKSDVALLAFARRHEICLDWLIRGRLEGLLFMAEWARRPGAYAAGRSW